MNVFSQIAIFAWSFASFRAVGHILESQFSIELSEPLYWAVPLLTTLFALQQIPSDSTPADRSVVEPRDRTTGGNENGRAEAPQDGADRRFGDSTAISARPGPYAGARAAGIQKADGEPRTRESVLASEVAQRGDRSTAEDQPVTDDEQFTSALE